MLSVLAHTVTRCVYEPPALRVCLTEAIPKVEAGFEARLNRELTLTTEGKTKEITELYASKEGKELLRAQYAEKKNNKLMEYSKKELSKEYDAFTRSERDGRYPRYSTTTDLQPPANSYIMKEYLDVQLTFATREVWYCLPLPPSSGRSACCCCCRLRFATV